MKNLNPQIQLVSYLAAACVALSPTALAVDPPPDGGYPGENTAEGEDALFTYDTSIQGENTAIGHDALYNLSTGIFNTSVGDDTLLASTSGNNNTAFGWHAMSGNTTGSTNTGLGCDAIEFNTTGNNNIAIGFRAGVNSTTGSNDIYIGSRGGLAQESSTIRLGTKTIQQATYIAGISGKTVAGGVGVIIDVNGHLGTVVSSERFKDSIKPMEKASESILSLKPVTFRYKKDLDPNAIPQFGLVAEQVEKVNPDLVARDETGKPYTVRYEAVNAMLLNEFLKEHKRVQEQEAAMAEVRSTAAKQAEAIEQQQKEIKTLTEALKIQAAQIRKVNDRVTTEAAPRVANN